MIYDVILRKEENKYIARVKEWPEVIAKENTREEAINQIKTQLREYLTRQVEVIQVEVSLPAKSVNPWLDKLGWFKNDPTFDDLQAEIAAYRLEIDKSTWQNVE